MTATIHTTDIVVPPGIAFTFAADNDVLWLAPGTIIASGTDVAISGSSHIGLGLFIDGQIFSGSTGNAISLAGATANVVIGATGLINSNASFGNTALFLEGGGDSLFNEGEINGAKAIGVLASGGGNDVHNLGTIYGDVSLGDGADTFDTRHGTINGDVMLGNGSDTFDTRHGDVKGIVHGGLGDDTYIVDNPDITLVENASKAPTW